MLYSVCGNERSKLKPGRKRKKKKRRRRFICYDLQSFYIDNLTVCRMIAELVSHFRTDSVSQYSSQDANSIWRLYSIIQPSLFFQELAARSSC